MIAFVHTSRDKFDAIRAKYAHALLCGRACEKSDDGNNVNYKAMANISALKTANIAPSKIELLVQGLTWLRNIVADL